MNYFFPIDTMQKFHHDLNIFDIYIFYIWNLLMFLGRHSENWILVSFQNWQEYKRSDNFFLIMDKKKHYVSFINQMEIVSAIIFLSIWKKTVLWIYILEMICFPNSWCRVINSDITLNCFRLAVYNPCIIDTLTQYTGLDRRFMLNLKLHKIVLTIFLLFFRTK